MHLANTFYYVVVFWVLCFLYMWWWGRRGVELGGKPQRDRHYGPLSDYSRWWYDVNMPGAMEMAQAMAEEERTCLPETH